VCGREAKGATRAAGGGPTRGSAGRTPGGQNHGAGHYFLGVEITSVCPNMVVGLERDCWGTAKATLIVTIYDLY
jgi:hypothetical protein